MSNKFTKHIPNAITCCNLISGCIAIVMTLQGELAWAGFFILISALFDFFDGLLARLLNAYSEIGKQLDSLADVISFGVAPAMMLFYTLEQINWPSSWGCWTGILPYTAFIMAAFSALRLAKFNLDTRQSLSFIGLNTPTNAIFWVALLAFNQTESNLPEAYEALGLIILSLIFSGLLIAEIPMFSLKSFSRNWKENISQYIVILGGIVFVSFMGIAGLTPTIGLYIIVSLLAKYHK